MERESDRQLENSHTAELSGGLMNIGTKRFWLQFAAMAWMCFFSLACLWAQNDAAGAGKSEPSVIAAVTQPADANTSKPHDDSFVIGKDDVLAVNVWKEPDISRSIPVRSDGKISLPLVGEVQAAGLTPLKLEADITGKLQAYLTEPEVTVIVEKINSEKFNILGRVAKP